MRSLGIRTGLNGTGLPCRVARRQTHVIASSYVNRWTSRGSQGKGGGTRDSNAAGRPGSRTLAPRQSPRRPPRRGRDDSDSDDDDYDDDREGDDEEDGFLDDDRQRRPSYAAPRRQLAADDRRPYGEDDDGRIARQRRSSSPYGQPRDGVGRGTRELRGGEGRSEGRSAMDRRAPPAAGAAYRDREGPSPRRAMAGSGEDRRPPSPSGPRASASWDRDLPGTREEPVDPFDNMIGQLHANVKEGAIVRPGSWEKLFGHVRSARQAHATLELMLQDAGAREAARWDWDTHGYGQTPFQLVQVAAEVGAPELAEEVLEKRELLHLALNKNLLPDLMRKVAAAMLPAGGRDEQLDGQLRVIRRLYGKEKELRGANTPKAAYELSRVLRRAQDAAGVRALVGQIERERIAVRDDLDEVLRKWLVKRGVQL